MSVICQNFVQNAWKKDLCSNCFKSLDDHSSPVGGCGGRTTWKSLITERDRNGNCTKPFRLENGFHGKLLTIVPALNGDDVSTNKPPEVLAVNGHDGRILGILRTPGCDRTPTKTAVGFKEEEPLIIGYGGNDYDLDEPEFELSNHEDGDFILDSLDETDEDRAISKITRENTEFNAKNANLLPAPTEEERNSRNRRKAEPPPKASVKPFFRQTTWSEQTVAVNAARDKQASRAVEEAPKEAVNSGKEETVMPSEPQAVEESRNSAETAVETPKSYAARTSFLHGATNAPEEFTTPTALYTPGDDLFVSRGSTDSSSSDETAVSEYPSEESGPPSDVMEAEGDKQEASALFTDATPASPVEGNKSAEPIQHPIDDSVLYDDGTTIYYAVSPACIEVDKQSKRTSVPVINHYAECGIYQDVSPNRTPSPPESSRNSRLAALAVELEQARYAGGTSVKRQAPSPPDASGYSTPSQNSLPISTCSTPTVRSTPVPCSQDYTPMSTKSKSSSLGSGTSKSKILMCIGGGTDDTLNKGRKKFSLKKLLKRGSRDVEDYHFVEAGTPNPKAWKQNDFSKVKLEIIHPMDMVANDVKSIDSGNSENYQASSDCVSPESAGYDNLVMSPQTEGNELAVLPSRSNTARAIHRPPRPPKPPPPPRSQSVVPEVKGQRQTESPKPTSTVKAEEQNDSKSESPAENNSKPQVPKRQYKINGRSEYANLGDVRTSVAPKKPERVHQSAADGEKIESKQTCVTQEASEGQTDSDNTTPITAKPASDEARRKEESTSSGPSAQKVHCSTPPVPPPPPPSYGRIGCSSVSEEKPWTNLETSYSLLSAVNLDVLARILDNAVHDRCQLERPDKESLQWTDFDLEMEQPLQILSDKVIYDAIFKNTSRTPVTLLVNPWGLHSSLSGSRNLVRYPILAHFTDHVPRNFAFPEVGANSNAEGILTSVYVLHRARLSPLRSLIDEQDYEKEVCFAMLQLIHSLKVLQASGIEDIESVGHNVFFARTDRDRLHSLVFLSPDLPFEQAGDLFSSMTNSSRVSLCGYALSTMLLLLGVNKIDELKTTRGTFRKAVNVIKDVLLKEKSHSLSQAKSILDYVLWNAEDAIVVSDRMSLKTDNVLQRWLDVERARKLKSLAATSLGTNLTALEEHHLAFLVRSSARTLKEVAAML